MSAEQKLESLELIGRHSDKLTVIANSYAKLNDIAIQPETSEAFIQLVEAIGVLTLGQLSQLGTILDTFTELQSKK